MTPISLLASITETRAVSGRMASATCSGSSKPAGSAARRNDRQQRDLVAAAAETFERVEHRLVLGRDADEMIALALAAFGDAADRQVVAFGRAAGEDDFARLGADGRGNGWRAASTAVLGFPAPGMADAAGVAVLLAEVGQHRLDHARIDARRGVIVHVNARRLHRANGRKSGRFCEISTRPASADETHCISEFTRLSSSARGCFAVGCSRRPRRFCRENAISRIRDQFGTSLARYNFNGFPFLGLLEQGMLTLVMYLACGSAPECYVEEHVDTIAVVHVNDGAEMVFFFDFVQNEWVCLDHRWLASDMVPGRVGKQWSLAWRDDGDSCWRLMLADHWFETWEDESPLRPNTTAPGSPGCWFRASNSLVEPSRPDVGP